MRTLALDYAGRLRARDRSYAQCGEDRIAAFALHEMGIDLPKYLDIGAHHPTWLSNTFYFCRRGSSGVCVEADPTLLRRIKAPPAEGHEPQRGGGARGRGGPCST